MKNLRGVLCYEGTHYLGWQKTREGPSIEGELEKALQILLRHPVELQAASRTDAGVHAKGQVFNFFTSNEEIGLNRLCRGANALLPRDIQILALEETSNNFHPTLDATGKEYTYEICTDPIQLPFLRFHSWHFPYSLDIDAMQSASQALIGTHDFTSFCNDFSLLKPNPRCSIKTITFQPLGESRMKILVQGNRFLYKMMRNLAGSLVYVGCGKISSSSMVDILHAKDRRLAGVTAPAHGLYLQNVFYESI